VFDLNTGVNSTNRVAEYNTGKEAQFMARAVQSTPEVLSLDASAKEESGLFSIASVLNLQKLIFAG